MTEEQHGLIVFDGEDDDAAMVQAFRDMPLEAFRETGEQLKKLNRAYLQVAKFRNGEKEGH